MISRVYEKLKESDESFFLQIKSKTGKNAIGNKLKVWTDLKELNGAVFEKKEPQDNVEGQYDKSYDTNGYFDPFDYDETNSYRIKRFFADSKKVQLYKIIYIYKNNRNNQTEFMKLLLKEIKI